MAASADGHAGLRLLNNAFVSIPHAVLQRFSELDLTHEELVVLMQIMANMQVASNEILSPNELGRRCKLSERSAGEILGGLIDRGYLEIRESQNALHFDLHPFWVRIATQTPVAEADTPVEVDTPELDLVSLFEQEFGRPLSGLECEQIRTWLTDGYPEWMLVEALREAVLANKVGFRYMDRMLYDWQRNRIRSRQDLEQYRQSYRERTMAREESAATMGNRGKRNNRANASTPPKANASERDERYLAFYELFPDS